MSTVLVFVDCESQGPCPVVGKLTEFGAVIDANNWFHGHNDTAATFARFDQWLDKNCKGRRPVFVSDNPAYDWQWINYGFWLHRGYNPFGHSARRISDFYAGLVGNWTETQKWKRLRVTEHRHNPVDDAMGNYEAFQRLMAGER